MSALIQGTREWEEFRKRKIGSSDAPVIMEMSPWKTPYMLWEEKLGFYEEKMNFAMQKGKDLEETARKLYEQESGRSVVPMVLQHPEYDFLIASLDGITFDMKNIVEIKCPGKKDHSLAQCGIIPQKYFPQVQHQLMVTGLDMAHYFSYFEGDGVIVEVPRDQKYIDKLLKKEIEFVACLQELKAPELTEKDYITREDDLWKNTEHQWLECSEKLEQLKAEEEKLRESLIHLAGNHNVIGKHLKLTKIIRKGSIDYSKVPFPEDVNLDDYRKPSTVSWRLTKS